MEQAQIVTTNPDIKSVADLAGKKVSIGASGSGKSTLMNVLGLLDIPTYGEYHLDGTDVTTLTDKQQAHMRNKQIGFIFQGFNLIANLTALENVELPLIYRGVPRKERTRLSETALEKVGLGKRKTHKPSEMSGGQQQRVAIARAIAQAPPIILADEPTGNLDSGSTKEIMEILKGLHEEGRTVILITHDNDIAAQAKRVIKIMDGRIVSDTADEDTAGKDAAGNAGDKKEKTEEPAARGEQEHE